MAANRLVTDGLWQETGACGAMRSATFRRTAADFVEALRSRVVYLWEGRVHASDTRRALNRNDGRGGMKRLMEQAAARHAETVHYSASVGIRVRGSEARKVNTLYLMNARLCPDEVNVVSDTASELWHKRLCHMSMKG